MSDLPPSPETPAKKAEAAAIRRRWITLGEVLAVVAVLISALTLWNNYRERSDAEAGRQAAEQRSGVKAATLVLKGAPGEDARALTITPVDPSQTIQNQAFRFPNALLIDSVEITGEGRLEAEWFETKLKRAREAAGRSAESHGDERLPVGVVTRFFADGTTRDDVAIYDVGYAIEGEFLKGKVIRLRGLSLVERTSPTALQARLDAVWRARAARK